MHRWVFQQQGEAVPMVTQESFEAWWPRLLPGLREERWSLACYRFRGQAVKLIRPSFRAQPG